MPANDLTIAGAYTINQYKLTFTIDGETLGEPQTVDYNSAITLPQVEDRTGYTFVWKNAVANMPADDLTIEGVFTANKYTLSFTIDGEAYGAAQEVDYNSAITLPEVEARTGYTFAWTNAVDTMPADDLTIAGAYTINQYKLSFTVDGVAYGTEQMVDYNSEITLPEVAAKTGYKFAWTNAVDNMPADDLTIAGVFTANKYKLTFTVDGVAYGTEQIVDYNSAITLPEVAAKTGYTFAWSNAVANMPADDLTIAGAYTINQYKVTFKHGDQAVAEVMQDYNADITLPEITGYDVAWKNEDHQTKVPAENVEIEVVLTVRQYSLSFVVDGMIVGSKLTLDYGSTITYPRLIKTGYTLVWNKTLRTMPAENTVINGEFRKNTYKLTFVIDGVVKSTSSLAYGDAIEYPSVSEKEGHVFAWELELDKMPANNTVIRGAYTVLSFDLVIKDTDGNGLFNEKVAYGTEIKLPERTGYTSSWVTENVPSTMPASATELVCKFTINKYTLSFTIDGEVYGEPQQVDYNSEIKLPEVAAKEGYTFAWTNVVENMPADALTIAGAYTANKYKVTFKQGDKVISEVTQDYNSDIVLPELTGYDVTWKNEDHLTKVPAENAEIKIVLTARKYTLNFTVDGEAYGEPQEVDYNSEIKLPEVAAKEGYTFAWTNAVDTMPAEALTIAGTFTINKYKVTFKQGDQVISEEMQDYNTAIVLPEVAGHDVILKNSSTSPTKVPAEDVVIEVILIAHYHTLIIKDDNDIFVAMSVAYGSTIEIPQREGFNFVWITPSEPVTTMPDETLIIVGKYENAMYKVTFVQGEGENKQVVDEKEFLFGAEISLPEVIGYDVAWKDASLVPETMPAEAIELEVVLTARKYKLTFMVDGVAYGTEQTVDYNSAITLPEIEARTGYTFAWTNAVEKMPADDLTIAGAYTINQYKLIFTVDGVAYGTEQMVDYNSTITLPDVAAKTGYTFAWTNAVANMPADDLTIAGVFTANKYKLTFTVDGVAYGTEQIVDYNSAITLPEVAAKTGYTFAWTNAVEKMPAGDLTIAGAYTADASYFKAKVDNIEGKVYYGGELFHAIKDAYEAYNAYGESDRALLAEDYARLEAYKQQYVNAANGAIADLDEATNVVSVLLSALVEVALAAVAAIVIKRRLF